MEEFFKLLKDTISEAKERKHNKYLSSMLLFVIAFNHNGIIDLLWYSYQGATYTKYYLNNAFSVTRTILGLATGFAWAMLSNIAFVALDNFKHEAIEKRILRAHQKIQEEKAKNAFEIAKIKSGTKSLEEATRKSEQLESELNSERQKSFSLKEETSVRINDLESEIAKSKQESLAFKVDLEAASTEASQAKSALEASQAEKATLEKTLKFTHEELTKLRREVSALRKVFQNAIKDNNINSAEMIAVSRLLDRITEEPEQESLAMKVPRAPRMSKFAK